MICQGQPCHFLKKWHTYGMYDNSRAHSLIKRAEAESWCFENNVELPELDGQVLSKDRTTALTHTRDGQFILTAVETL